MAKFTRASFKKFVKDNRTNLFIKEKAAFSGMTDCVESNQGAMFKKVESTTRNEEYTLGIDGVWLVGDGGDSFYPFNDGIFSGFEVYNCCGNFILAVKIEKQA